MDSYNLILVIQLFRELGNSDMDNLWPSLADDTKNLWRFAADVAGIRIAQQADKDGQCVHEPFGVLSGDVFARPDHGQSDPRRFVTGLAQNEGRYRLTLSGLARPMRPSTQIAFSCTRALG